MLNKGVHPIVPEKGSLGSSGDLAPLSHMVLTMLGEGEAIYKGARMDSKDAMEKDGMNYIDAAMQAAKLRFRAVMMTNIAFILGLLPLVFAHGAGAGSRHSIGMTVFGGMIAVSCIGSILVPAFFVLINKMKDWYYAGGLKKAGKSGFGFLKQTIQKIQEKKHD